MHFFLLFLLPRGFFPSFGGQRAQKGQRDETVGGFYEHSDDTLYHTTINKSGRSLGRTPTLCQTLCRHATGSGAITFFWRAVHDDAPLQNNERAAAVVSKSEKRENGRKMASGSWVETGGVCWPGTSPSGSCCSTVFGWLNGCRIAKCALNKHGNFVYSFKKEQRIFGLLQKLLNLKR